MRPVLLILLAVQHAASTEWGRISPLLTGAEWADYLPSVPSQSHASSVYGTVAQSFGSGYPFASYTVSVAEAGVEPTDAGIVAAAASAICNTTAAPSAVEAGPRYVCPALDTGAYWGACSGPGLSEGSEVCRSTFMDSSVQLGIRAGTYWAAALAAPAWARYVFPAAPVGTSKLSLRYELDARYRPELFGGNPCPNASATYNCSLCTAGAWDFSQPPGFYILWSAAGRSAHVVTGPHTGHAESFDEGILSHVADAPDSLQLQPGEHPVVTFLTFSQYGAPGEVARDSSGRCSVAWSDDLPGYQHTYRDHPLMLSTLSLMYRQALSLPSAPPNMRPRLYGTDDVWYPQRVRPFFNAPCDADAKANIGWFEEVGVLDVKGRFELSARGFRSCYATAIDGGDITAFTAARAYLLPTAGEAAPSYVVGRRCLHLVRRLWACAAVQSGSFVGCEYNGTEALRLAHALVSVEMARFGTVQWSCGVSCGGSAGGAAVFDLDTAAPVEYYSLWYDVLSSRTDVLPPSNASLVADALRAQIDLFRSSFWQGGWQLWNGNNWTPHLAIAALMWAVAFYHEDAVAGEVLRMVNDILWLHRPYYTSDGVYKEGVVMYSIMSIQGLVQAAVVQRASFGAAPLAIDVNALRAVVRCTPPPSLEAWQAAVRRTLAPPPPALHCPRFATPRHGLLPAGTSSLPWRPMGTQSTSATPTPGGDGPTRRLSRQHLRAPSSAASPSRRPRPP